jgi:general secretion pathway protein G
MDMESGAERHRAAAAGFSLVELMLVILLVGIVVAIAVPYFGAANQRVKTAQAISDITGNEAVVETYRVMNNALPNSWADMPMARTIDPWGRPYVYYNIQANGKGQARKDHALNPLNTDYDMYSVGPDGVTKSQITQKDSLDDILRASDGGYVGVAAGF